MNFSSKILDEIALEGLDGITIEALWVRLLNREDFLLPPKDENAKRYIWHVVRRLRDVDFYHLEEPRPPLVLFDRWSSIEDELGMVLEPDPIPVDIYPHCLVADPANKIQGSCSTYRTRKQVTNSVRKLTLDEVVDIYGGEQLVIVASQVIRFRALTGSGFNPQIELNDFQYCCLERIGRSRHHGEVTQGRMGLQVLGVDSKTIFYFRKFLSKHKLITKQVFHMKSNGSHLSGRLIHLPRFYRLVKPKFVTLMEDIIAFLLLQPYFMCETSKLKERLGIVGSLRKLTKMPEFQKYVRSDQQVLYRTVYPNAEMKDWKHKACDKEKRLRVLYLIDPTFDPKELQKKLECEEDEDDENEDEHAQGILDQGKRCFDRPLMLQVLALLASAGPNGMSLTELSRALGLSKPNARTICKNIVRMNVIGSFMADVSRQRVTRYFFKRDKNTDMTAQISSEELKLSELTNIDGQKTEVDGSSTKEIVDTNELETVKVSAAMVCDTPFVECMEIVEDKSEENIEIERQTSTRKSVKRSIPSSSNQDDETVKKSKLDVNTVIVYEENDTAVESDQHDSSLSTPEKTIFSEVEAPTPGPSCTTDKTINQSHSPEERACKIDIQITDDLNWLKTRGYLTKDTSKSCNAEGYRTMRLLKRWNLILETVQNHKVLNNLKSLHTVINEHEGGDSRIDRKSLLRILYKMAVDRLIKIYKATLYVGTIVHEINFICAPMISPDHPLIKSTIELAKLKFSSKVKIDNSLPAQVSVKSEDDVIQKKEEEPNNQKQKKEELVLMNKFDFSEEHKSNLNVPKFMKMRYLHIFMYYLIYGYEGNVDLNQDEAKTQIAASCQGCLIESTDSFSFIYDPNVSWKMFVPPLPQHREYKTGWALLADVILRLPLSMFLHLVRIPYVIPYIDLYIDHPIKRHTLVKDLPVPVRNCLTYKRKYVFSIYEVLSRLAYVGLAQLGPQSLKEKDHVFVYLNKNAILLDTKTSRLGYHKVSDDITYDVLKYRFDRMVNVERYWLDMWKICMHTNLGSRSCVVGTDVILENIQDKQEMVAILSARTAEDVVERDVGYLPGDHLGAAGFDSALFSHLKRNWSFRPFKIEQKVFKPTEKSNQLTKKPFKLAESKNHSVYSLLAKRKKNFIMNARRTAVTTQPGNKKLSKPRVTVRHVKPKRWSQHRQPFYDQVDREALQRMSKLRVDWTKSEDKLLLLCKVVQLMLAPAVKSAILGNMYISTREILHDTFPSSRNKTSRACQRRTNYMLKSQSTCHSLNLCIEELRQDNAIMEKYGNLFDELKAKHDNRAQLIAEWNVYFKELFGVLMERYDNLSTLPVSNLCVKVIPDTLEEFYQKYTVMNPTKKVKLKHKFNPVDNLNDVYVSVINATIHSALCCSSDKTSWSYHLFSVYQQYPEKLLRSALTKLRSSLMVSLKRAWARTKMRTGNYLPLTASPYRLSISYINLMASKYSFDIYQESFELLKKIVEEHRLNIQSTGGATASIAHMVNKELVDFDIGIPDQVIVLNPNIQDEDENYTRLMKRYQEILSTYKQEILTTSCLFQKDNYATGSNNTEEDFDFNKEPISSNTIARAASRIALYLVRDSDDMSGVVPQDLQHVHDFFVVNSCTIVSNLKESLTPQEVAMVTDMSAVESLQKRLRDATVYPSNLMSDLQVDVVLSERFSPDKFDLAVNLLELAKSGGHLGVLCEKVVEEFGNSFEIKAILDELCGLKLLLCTGVAHTRYVHFTEIRPWLVHTYSNKRYEKDGRMSMNAQVMELSRKGEENEITKDEELINTRMELCEKEEDNDKNISQKEKEDIITKDNFTLKESEKEEDRSTSQERNSNEKRSRPKNEDITGNTSKIDVQGKIMNKNKVRGQKKNVIEYREENRIDEEGVRIQDEEELEKDEKTVGNQDVCSADLDGVDTEVRTSRKRRGSSVEGSCRKDLKLSEKEKIVVHSEDLLDEKLDKEEDISGRIGGVSDRVENSKDLDTSCLDLSTDGNENLDKDHSVENVENDSKDKSTDIKPFSSIKHGADSDNRKLSNPIKVLMRPWIKIDGSINRRVLDFMLSSVLSHIMLNPLVTLTALQERFSPALQPQHTREIGEFLIELGCIAAFTYKIVGTPSLFSKPCEIVLQNATGLEPATELRFEADKEAIINLGKFISTRQYTEGFMDMLFIK